MSSLKWSFLEFENAKTNKQIKINVSPLTLKKIDLKEIYIAKVLNINPD